MKPYHRSMATYILPIFIFALSVIVLQFTPLKKLHGGSDAPLITAIIGMLSFFCADVFNLFILKLTAAIGYTVTFIAAYFLQTTTLDPVRGATNNLWKLWLFSYFAVCVIAAAVSFLLKKTRAPEKD